MPDKDDAMSAIVGASITYRLAFGPNAGNKALTPQTVPASTNFAKPSELVSRQSGFSLHAGVACKSTQRKKLERLWLGPCRYITRSAIAEQRLSLASNGNVIVGLKTPYDDGTTHVVFSRGGHPPNSKLRQHVVPQQPAKQEQRQKPKAYGMTGPPPDGRSA